MANRTRVWLVDDREENRKTFLERHGTEFDVRTFENPDQLMRGIQEEGPPDALLCGIFYYQDASEQEAVEERVEA
jgi:DNA-binding NtrC family response regulator